MQSDIKFHSSSAERSDTEQKNSEAFASLRPGGGGGKRHPKGKFLKPTFLAQFWGADYEIYVIWLFKGVSCLKLLRKVKEKAAEKCFWLIELTS